MDVNSGKTCNPIENEKNMKRHLSTEIHRQPKKKTHEETLKITLTGEATSHAIAKISKFRKFGSLTHCW